VHSFFYFFPISVHALTIALIQIGMYKQEIKL